MVTTPASTTETVVMVAPDGRLTCDCKRYQANKIFYGSGECQHTEAAQEARNGKGEIHNVN